MEHYDAVIYSPQYNQHLAYVSDTRDGSFYQKYFTCPGVSLILASKALERAVKAGDVEHVIQLVQVMQFLFQK